MTASIAPPVGCKQLCSVTYRAGSWASEAGTHAAPGHIRYCEHGHIWICVPAWAPHFDFWDRLTRWRNPILHRRAQRILAAAPQSRTTTGQKRK